MGRRELGVVLRLFGPLVQLIGLGVMFTGRDPSRRLGTLPLRAWGLLGFTMGLVIVIVGLLLSLGRRAPALPDRRPDEGGRPA